MTSPDDTAEPPDRTAPSTHATTGQPPYDSPAQPPYDTVLFDLDGTLTDSAPGILDALAYMAERLRITITPEQQRRMLGPPFLDSFPRVLGLDTETTQRGIAIYRERYLQVVLSGNRVFDGIPELLSDLVACGVVLALATSKPLPTATAVVEHFDLAQAFTVLGGATFDGRIDTKSEVIASVLPQLPEPGRLVLVGDRAEDVRGAAAHGFDCIGVGWGYGTAEELRDAGAVVYAPTVPDLRALLLP